MSVPDLSFHPCINVSIPSYPYDAEGPPPTPPLKKMRLDDPFRSSVMSLVYNNNYEVTDEDDDDEMNYTKSNNILHQNADDEDDDDDDDPSVMLLVRILQKAIELAGGEDVWDMLEEDMREQLMTQAKELESEGRIL